MRHSPYKGSAKPADARRKFFFLRHFLGTFSNIIISNHDFRLGTACPGIQVHKTNGDITLYQVSQPQPKTGFVHARFQQCTQAPRSLKQIDKRLNKLERFTIALKGFLVGLVCAASHDYYLKERDKTTARKKESET
jgi:hypothetical protein